MMHEFQKIDEKGHLLWILFILLCNAFIFNTFQHVIYKLTKKSHFLACVGFMQFKMKFHHVKKEI